MTDMHEAPETSPLPPKERASAAQHEDEPISAIVIQEAAAAIEAVGRELTQRQEHSLREFLRGPAVRVGVAVSVLGATLWIQELIERHHASARRAGITAGRSRRSRRKATPSSAPT